MPRESQTLNVFSAPDVSDPASGTWALLQGTPVSDSASFQARWDEDGVTVRVDVVDSTTDPRDAVTLSTADGSWTLTRDGASPAGLQDVTVTTQATGWSVVAALPKAGLSEGTVVPFEVSVTDDAAAAGWNGAGALGSLVLVEALSSTTAA